MMSTSVEGHIHLSESAANKMMSWQRTSDASSWPFAVVHRGKIAVKGKGDVDTYWLQASMVESAQAIKRSDRNLRLQADPMHMPVVAAPPANLSESCTVDPTVAVSRGGPDRSFCYIYYFVEFAASVALYLYIANDTSSTNSAFN